mgnify:CR=1 FL=1
MSTKTKSEDQTDAIERTQRQLRRKNKKIRNLYIVIAVLAVALVGGSVFGYTQYREVANENKRLSNPEESAKLETERLKAQIAKLVDVPADEEPTIATVVDIGKLKNQPFFAKAENGDKVFMYSNAKKAILFRPSTGKVIELAPINNQEQTPDKQEGVSSNQESGTTQTNPSPTPAGGTETPSGLAP